MRHGRPEAGALPAIGAIAATFFNTANVALTGYFVYDMFSSQPAEEFAASLPPEELERCQSESSDGFTPSARAMAIDDLEGWRKYAQRDLSGYGEVAQKAAQKTIDSLAELYAQERDSGGLVVGPCHVYAGTFIIQRQLEALKKNPMLPVERKEPERGSTDVDLASAPIVEPKRSALEKAAPVLAIAAAVGAAFVLTRSS